MNPLISTRCVRKPSRIMVYLLQIRICKVQVQGIQDRTIREPALATNVPRSAIITLTGDQLLGLMLPISLLILVDALLCRLIRRMSLINPNADYQKLTLRTVVPLTRGKMICILLLKKHAKPLRRRMTTTQPTLEFGPLLQ